MFTLNRDRLATPYNVTA